MTDKEQIEDLTRQVLVLSEKLEQIETEILDNAWNIGKLEYRVNMTEDCIDRITYS